MTAETHTAQLAELEDGSEQWVITVADGALHPSASSWLRSLADLGRSPNTIKNYGRRVAAYLSWTAKTSDWRAANLSHLRLWMRTVSADPSRSPATVALWMVAVRSFYIWAASGDLLHTDVASRMTQLKYFAPGTAGGGERGAYREVLVPELRPTVAPRTDYPEWIESADARERLESTLLSKRDRFIVDLIYFTGIRAGEALSLFRSDMHFGGGSAALNCNRIDPHFHVRMDNPTENGARAKGKERVLYVSTALIDRYVDYMIERDAILGEVDRSPHVLVNLYSDKSSLGRAMSDSGLRDVVQRLSSRIDYPMSGAHVLRHTFATRLARGIGCEPQPLDVIQDVLGHRSIKSTLIYTHSTEEAKKAALASVQPRQIDILAHLETLEGAE